MTSFEGLKLIEPLLRAVEASGFTAPTEIQSATIPALLEGRDLMGISQTGGGKTAAFCLPMLQRLAENPKRSVPGQPRALILAPTRELANQIGQCLRDFKKGIRLFSSVVYGGAPMGPQIQELRRGVDILVATPGRLLDHMSRNTVRFDDVEVFVLDEADRMLDLGFSEDVLSVAALLPKDHQTVMFSATMPAEVKHLTDRLLNNPVMVQTAPQSSVTERVTQRGMFVTRHNKTPLLVQLLKREGADRVLVFTKTKADADELSFQLRDEGVQADAIHGDKQQRIRQKILRNFRDGRFPVLVATDVAARGIDVPGISHVINYDLPTDPENYVHRIGRTGRGGADGIAISFCEPRDVRHLRNIERTIRQDVEIDADHEFHSPPAARREGAGAGRPEGRGRNSNFGSGRPSGRPGAGGGAGRGFGGGRDGERSEGKRRFDGPRDGERRFDRADRPAAARRTFEEDRAPDRDKPRFDGPRGRNERSDFAGRNTNDRPERSDRADRGARFERSGGRGEGFAAAAAGAGAGRPTSFRPRSEQGEKPGARFERAGERGGERGAERGGEKRFAGKPRVGADRGKPGGFASRDRDDRSRDFSADRPRRAEGRPEGRSEGGRSGQQGLKRRSA
ncbi:DEAD/DEAH box helicase [Thalassospira sp.]|uniref:DEAD/DEAH box helicase n=1 Tax=Thalassospira sp. TaxID=1912094 RepID=UPI0027333DA7|nr:DEAD/DEAH box helicase [Thalassospira sp.]MDP2698975.1 DEAD/DEAH box helicase [Thalassospira sp.]